MARFIRSQTLTLLEKLNELRANSRIKENVQEVTFSTAGSYGSKVKE